MRLIFDIEANSLTPDIVHCIVARDVDTDEEYVFRPDQLEAGLELLAQADCLIGHNIMGYDLPALKNIFDFDYEGEVRDTLVMCRLIWSDVKNKDFTLYHAGKLPPKMIGSHSLKAWGYRLGELKGEFGEQEDFDVFTEQMLEYCRQDVVVNKRLFSKIESKKYSEDAIKLEHEVHHHLLVQEYLGFPFDEQAGWKLYGELSNRRTEIEAELQEVFLPWREETEFIPKVNNKKLGYVKGEPFIKVKETVFNPCSREHIARALRERYDWQPAEFTETGLAKVDETVLSTLNYPEAKLLSEYLMLQKRLGQLGEGKQAWLKLVKKGRIHGRVNHMGTHTSRCTHSHPNCGQIPSAGATYGSACRSLFIAPRGFRLVGCDVSGLELRCLAHYMALYDSGEYANQLLTGDIHTTNMEAAGLPSRSLAKTFIYGFLYGGGDEKIGSIVGKDAQAGRRLKAQFLKKTPALAKLRDNVSRAAENRGYLKVLDGRRVPVRHKHASLNTLLQSTGAIICKRWLVEFHRKMQTEGFVLGEDYYQAAFVHDELQIIAKESITERVGALCVEAIKDAGEAYNFRLRLDGEYNVGKNWAETH